MTSSDFSNLLRKFPDLDASDYAALEDQLKKTSYCQALYILQARARKNTGDPQTLHFIQQAAVYTSDRVHLKHLLEQHSTATVVAEYPQEKTPKAEENPEALQTNPSAEDQQAGSLSDDLNKKSEPSTREVAEEVTFAQQFSDIADELMIDLQILKEKTEAFQQLTTVRPKLIKRSAPIEPASIPSEPPSVSLPTASPTIKSSRAMDETDLLISEIKSTRKKIKADSGKLAEQLDIIDQFIKSNQVTIRPPEKGNKKQDLAETAGTYSENVISETLVEILIRQGKKDKAVDVLRKLIWKFPQKKHLFAARIQELSN